MQERREKWHNYILINSNFKTHKVYFTKLKQSQVFFNLLNPCVFFNLPWYIYTGTMDCAKEIPFQRTAFLPLISVLILSHRSLILSKPMKNLTTLWCFIRSYQLVSKQHLHLSARNPLCMANTFSLPSWITPGRKTEGMHSSLPQQLNFIYQLLASASWGILTWGNISKQLDCPLDEAQL